MMPLRTTGVLAVAALVLASTREAHADERVGVCADAAERGQELRDAHKLVEARPQFVICAQRECPNVVRVSCTEWLAELDRRTPSVVADVKDDEGHDIAGVTVSLDGAPLRDGITSSAVAVNPGSHVMRYAAPGYEPVEESVVLHEGEPLRTLKATLRRSGAPVGKDKPVPGEPAARPFPIMPVVLGGASLIALSIFAYSGLTGMSDYRRLEKDCGPRCSTSQIDGVRSKFLVADVALVVGIVTGGAAVGFWLFDRPASPRAAASRP
jgi:hypothetical protein